jgi:acyl-CoA reductase-like NAD-dependent aldehyde dehydrogenase
MFNYTLREPIGVCGQLIPWNFPPPDGSVETRAALAAATRVVLKPAEQTPVGAMELAKLIQEADSRKASSTLFPVMVRLPAPLSPRIRHRQSRVHRFD